MLSAMTTSENFPSINQPGCPGSPYGSIYQPSYLASLLRQNPEIAAGSGLNCRLFEDSPVSGGKIPSFSYYPSSPKKEGTEFFDESEEVTSENIKEESDLFGAEVPRNELENGLIDLLEQLETDDSSCDQVKPLKIDPNVLKLDFSKLSNQIKGTVDSFHELYRTDDSEIKRVSHHLSGGGLLMGVSSEEFPNTANDFLKNRICKLSGGGLIATENVFNFEDLEPCSGGSANFASQISPSSPLTFDIPPQCDQVNSVTSGISSESESTNPFKNFIKCALEENSFSPTNPFSDVCSTSSLEACIPSCVPPRYENISLPQKSFSQCSTRPTSPVLKSTQEPSNPFLINETSPEPQTPAAPHPQQLVLSDSKFPSSANTIPNSSSFIFAVPVFPVFQPSITSSSTQTVDLPEVNKLEEPVYQNITNQLRKFMKRNDHSEYDLQCLKATVKDLRISGWYYENVSWQESVVLLTNTEPGTFLIRDSSDPNFLFSLSVQTSRGPTSVRIHYVNGQFRLDAEEKLIPHMPSFNSVIDLIDYYVENTMKNKSNNRLKSVKKTTKHKLQKSKDQVWIDSQGNIYSNILLVKPLFKRDHFSTLQHLARLTINRHIKKKLNAKVKFNFRVTPVYESSPFQDSSFQNNFDNFCPVLSIDALPLPSKLLEYLKEYPYCH